MVREIWKFMSENDITIDIKIPDFPLAAKNDTTIMLHTQIQKTGPLSINVGTF